MEFSNGAKKKFPGRAESGEISFYPLEGNRTLFAKNIKILKISNFKIQGSQVPPSDDHASVSKLFLLAQLLSCQAKICSVFIE